MLKLTTINLIVEAILAEKDNCSPGSCEAIANEAVIYYKTAMICESQGIDEAMKYFTGTHDSEEYQEYRTACIPGWEEKDGQFLGCFIEHSDYGGSRPLVIRKDNRR